MYYDREGKPVELLEWARLLEDADYREVVVDTVGATVVSTVWLGIDPVGDGFIFETAVYQEGKALEQHRYRTEAEAVAGHAEVLVRIREK